MALKKEEIEQHTTEVKILIGESPSSGTSLISKAENAEDHKK